MTFKKTVTIMKRIFNDLRGPIFLHDFWQLLLWLLWHWANRWLSLGRERALPIRASVTKTNLLGTSPGTSSYPIKKQVFLIITLAEKFLFS